MNNNPAHHGDNQIDKSEGERKNGKYSSQGEDKENDEEEGRV